MWACGSEIQAFPKTQCVQFLSQPQLLNVRAGCREGEGPLWEGVPCLRGGAGTCAVTMPAAPSAPGHPRPEAQLSEAGSETRETDGDMRSKSHHKRLLLI